MPVMVDGPAEQEVIACVDVHYQGDHATAACVLIDAWQAATSIAELTCDLHGIEPYQPGAFYRRELPCLLEVLRRARQPFGAIIIDGYVWLSAAGRPGLGAHLHEAMGGSVPVIGVAKTAFHESGALQLLRGASKRPLFITAAGMDPALAARHVSEMNGASRIPAMLARADRLARGLLSVAPAESP